jgi:hypothetical protein
MVATSAVEDWLLIWYVINDPFQLTCRLFPLYVFVFQCLQCISNALACCDSLGGTDFGCQTHLVPLHPNDIERQLDEAA